MSETSKVVHRARTCTTGGRERGISRSSDGRLDVRLAMPGLDRIGTNPEHLFAAAWSACFETAIALAAQRKTALPAGVIIDAAVDLNVMDGGQFLSVRFNVQPAGRRACYRFTLIDEAREYDTESNTRQRGHRIRLIDRTTDTSPKTADASQTNAEAGRSATISTPVRATMVGMAQAQAERLLVRGAVSQCAYVSLAIIYASVFGGMKFTDYEAQGLGVARGEQARCWAGSMRLPLSAAVLHAFYSGEWWSFLLAPDRPLMATPDPLCSGRPSFLGLFTTTVSLMISTPGVIVVTAPSWGTGYHGRARTVSSEGRWPSRNSLLAGCS